MMFYREGQETRVEEGADHLEPIEPESEGEHALEVVEHLVFAKGEDWVDVVSVLKSVLDESLSLLDEDSVLSSDGQGGFLEAPRQQTDVPIEGKESLEVLSMDALNTPPLKKDGENWQVEAHS
jgi:hypothetical protein